MIIHATLSNNLVESSVSFCAQYIYNRRSRVNVTKYTIIIIQLKFKFLTLNSVVRNDYATILTYMILDIEYKRTL